MRKQKGEAAEQQACQFLISNGLHLITQNYRCKFGEIDLIMRDNSDIVFVEVRSRASKMYGTAIESITQNKQKKIVYTSMHFLQHTQWINKVNCRFDVIGIHPDSIEWIKHAFMVER